jgi:hypothetical protein
MTGAFKEMRAGRSAAIAEAAVKVSAAKLPSKIRMTPSL